MNIALDLDGVIADIGSAIQSKIPDIMVQEVAKCLFSAEGYPPLNHIFNDQLFWRNLKPIKDSWHKINEWFYQGHDIFFVTARRSVYSIVEIRSWLEGWQIPYTEYFVCDMMNKHAILKTINADIFIDDNPFEILDCKEKLDIKSNLQVKALKTWYNFDLILKHNVNYISSFEDIKIG